MTTILNASQSTHPASLAVHLLNMLHWLLLRLPLRQRVLISPLHSSDNPQPQTRVRYRNRCVVHHHLASHRQGLWSCPKVLFNNSRLVVRRCPTFFPVSNITYLSPLRLHALDMQLLSQPSISPVQNLARPLLVVCPTPTLLKTLLSLLILSHVPHIQCLLLLLPLLHILYILL